MNLPLASTMIPLIGAIFAGLVVGWVLPDPWRARSRKGYIVPPAPKDRDDEGSPAALRERAELAEREAEMLQSQLHSLRAAQRAQAERESFGNSEDGPNEIEELREKLEAADQDREQLQAQLEELQTRTRQQQRKLDEAADRLVEFERERMKKGEGLGRRSAPKKDEPRSNETDGDRKAKWVEPLIAASRGDAKDTKPTKPEPTKTFDPEPAGVALATADPPVDLELERDELELGSGFSQPLESPGEPVALEIQRSEPLSVQGEPEELEIEAEAAPEPVAEVESETAPEPVEETEPETPLDAASEPESEIVLEPRPVADDPLLLDPREEGRIVIEPSETDAVELPEDLPDLEIDEDFETPVEAESEEAPEPAEEAREPTDMGAEHGLDAIDGLKPDVIERLGLIGVKSTFDLVRKGAKRSGVNGLASGMSLHTNEVDRWVSAADLLRIERMRHQDVNDLVAKNVTSVQVLAGSDPANLVKRLGDAGSNATEKVVQEWIARAKQLKPIIRW